MPASQSGAHSSVPNSDLVNAPSNRLQVSRPLFMPETFTGVGREWSDWSEQFEMAAQVNGWDNELKLKFMSLLLSGRARDIYGGLPCEAKNNYMLLKDAMGKCLEPCESADWSRVSFSSRVRLPNETAREFGNALRRLIYKAYPSADVATQDLLARDHFVAHVGNGDMRIHLRSAKPATLESAINLASELELIRNLEHTQCLDTKVRGLSTQNPPSDNKVEVLLSMVEELRQEVKALQVSVKEMQTTQIKNRSSPAPIAPKLSLSEPPVRARTDACWECGCTRHLRRNCPYLQGK